MSSRKRRKTIKPRSLEAANSGAGHSDILQASDIPSSAFPDPQSSNLGKGGEDVKPAQANLSCFPGLKDAVGTEDENAGELLLAQVVDTIPKFL